MNNKLLTNTGAQTKYLGYASEMLSTRIAVQNGPKRSGRFGMELPKYIVK